MEVLDVVLCYYVNGVCYVNGVYSKMLLLSRVLFAFLNHRLKYLQLKTHLPYEFKLLFNLVVILLKWF